MVLVREVEEPRINALGLQDVEERETVRLGKPVVKRVVDDKLGSREIGDVVLGVEFLVCGVGIVNRAIEVVADEPELCTTR
jgi:hypothetical protein